MSHAMTRVVLDPALRSQLPDLSSHIEFCDETGRTLGYFVPAPVAPEVEPWIYEWAKAQISDEELERRRHEPGGRTTAEVLARLRG